MEQPSRKIPVPRRLDLQETAASLRLWKMHFRNYYRSDPHFSHFLKSTTTWNIRHDTYGFEAEAATSVLKRTAADMKEDCIMFLEIFASYLPSDYLVERVTKNTTSVEEVFKVIEEYYGVVCSSDTFLQLAKFSRKPQETYRQFYLRMEGFVSKHLTKPGVKHEELEVAARGDLLTISMKNLLVIMWMQRINERLIDCVRIEFANELRANAPLISLMTRIADNVDSILARHDVAGAVARLELEDDGDYVGTEHDVSREAAIRQVWEPNEGEYNPHYINRVGYNFSQPRGARNNAFHRGGRGNRPQGGRGGGAPPRQQVGGKVLNCPHCDYLSQTLRLKINKQHEATECPRKDIAVRNVDAEEDTAQDFVDFPVEEDQGGNSCVHHISPNWCPQFQMSESRCAEDVPPSADQSCFCGRGPDDISSSLSEINPSPLSDDLLVNSIIRVQQNLLRLEAAHVQSRSPALNVTINNQPAVSIVDSGAEVNAIGLACAKRANIKIVPTPHRARAADSTQLKIVGKAAGPVTLITDQHKIPLTLDYVVVVDQLNADILLGEPGKAQNNIVTFAKDKKIKVDFQSRSYTFDYLPPRGPVSHVIRAASSTMVYPGNVYKFEIPKEYSQFKHLHFQPQCSDVEWFQPDICQIQDGYVCLHNSSVFPVFLKKGKVFAEIRFLDTVDVRSLPVLPPQPPPPVEVCFGLPSKWNGEIFLPGSEEPVVVRKEGDGIASVNLVRDKYPDPYQYISKAAVPKVFKDHTDKIILDPDNVLSPAERTAVRGLCQEFKDVIRPEPGLYNGLMGHFDNKIMFKKGQKPPLTTKVYKQNLTEDMKKILADKMDQLHEWGVLQFPEHVGVRPIFVSPSMLVPKHDGGWRLVSNFAPLNSYIDKPVNDAPTIQECKDFLAQHKYHIHCDFANFFYQAGMEREDIQYLGTLHPYKGLMVFCCEAQGIQGAPEHSYERLGRIFGDFIREGLCMRMADGLHIGSNTKEGALDTFRKVLQLLRDCGMTLKPTKLEIFPKRTVLFGWKLEDSMWSPTAHTLSPLASAPLPKTITELRGFLGSFKQFSSCVARYGEILHDLEALTGTNKSGKLYVPWTKELEETFYKARDATRNVDAYAIPCRTDQLFTYSDYSKDHRAVGGKMEFERKMENGEVRRFLAGHFSLIMEKFRQAWYPCEGEGYAAKMVLKHFEPYIRENNNICIHFSDNQPVCDAFKRAKKGAFSANARLNTFLVTICNLPVEIRHKPGSQMFTADYASRHPQTCPDKTCSMCKFAYSEQLIGENCADLRHVSVEDITSGKVTMPMTGRKAWIDIQSEDFVHKTLKQLIATGGVPPARKTNGDYTKLKLLHNLFKQGNLRVEHDGLVTIKRLEKGDARWVTSVPYKLYPGLCTAYHLRFNHPSRTQLTKLMDRYYYCPGGPGQNSNVVSDCGQCQAMKVLPRTLTEHVASDVGSFGSNFGCDVMMRHGQKFLVTVESQTGFTLVNEIVDQTADSLREALLLQVVPFTPESGSVIRTDGASSFQTLKRESEEVDNIWSRLNIKIEIGARHNKNRNPQSENKIAEVLKEFLKHCPPGIKLSPLQVCEVTKTLNSRIRSNGLASREMLLSRSLMSHKYINLDDRDLSKEKFDQRNLKNSLTLKSQIKQGLREGESEFSEGDLVFIRDAKDKNNPRAIHIVHKILPNSRALVRKEQAQLQARTFSVPFSQLILHSCFRRPPQLSAQKNELDSEDIQSQQVSQQTTFHLPKKGKRTNSTQKNSSNGRKVKILISKHNPEQRKKEIVISRRKKDSQYSEKGIPGESALVSLNNAGRPIRKAAALANKAWISNISFYDADEVKLPWVPQDQDQDDDEDYLWLRHHTEGQVLAPQGPHQDGHHGFPQPQQAPVQPESPEPELGQPRTRDSSSEPSSPGSSSSSGSVSALTSSQSSSYQELPSVRFPSGDEYVWDEEQEQPSFVSAPTSPQMPPLRFPPPHWPPRRLSSEISNQLEVNLLGDYDPALPYFDADAIIDDIVWDDSHSPRPNSQPLAASSLGSLPTYAADKPNLSPVHHRSEDNLHIPSSSHHSHPISESEKFYHQRTGSRERNFTRGRKHSARLENKPRRDYKAFSKHGTTFD